jgi:hypothetical protein
VWYTVISADWLTDHVRLFSAIFFAGAVAMLTQSVILRGPKRTRRVRRATLWFWLVLANAAYASGYNYHAGVVVNLPTITSCAIALGTFLGLAWSPEGDDKYPPDDGALSTRFVLWLDRQVRAHKSRTSDGEEEALMENSPAPGTPQTKAKAVAATGLAFVTIVVSAWIADDGGVTGKEIVAWVVSGLIGSGLTGGVTAAVRNKPL